MKNRCETVGRAHVGSRLAVDMGEVALQPQRPNPGGYQGGEFASTQRPASQSVVTGEHWYLQCAPVA